MKKNENDDSTTTTTTNLHKHASFFLLSTYFFKHKHTGFHVFCFSPQIDWFMSNVQFNSFSTFFLFNFLIGNWTTTTTTTNNKRKHGQRSKKKTKKNYHPITNTELETIDSIKTKVFFSFLHLISSRAKLLTIGLHWSFFFCFYHHNHHYDYDSMWENKMYWTSK